MNALTQRPCSQRLVFFIGIILVLGLPLDQLPELKIENYSYFSVALVDPLETNSHLDDSGMRIGNDLHSAIMREPSRFASVSLFDVDTIVVGPRGLDNADLYTIDY